MNTLNTCILKIFLQLFTLKEAVDNTRDIYALDLIKIFNWDETDIGIDQDTFCTYVPSCQKEISVTVSDFLSNIFLIPKSLFNAKFECKFSYTGSI